MSVSRTDPFVKIGGNTDPTKFAEMLQTKPSFSDYGLVVRPIQPVTQFGELLTASRTPVVELNSTYGINEPLRDKVFLSNGGSTDDINGTVTTGEILLETNTDPDGSVLLESAEVGRYIPGYGAELGIGVRFDGAPSGTQDADWGGISSDGQNGFYFGRDSGGLYVARLRNGTETAKVYQANWNLDSLDGNGPSNFNIVLSNGNIFQIQFTWYGYGQIIFGVLGVVNGQQTFIAAHSLANFEGTSVQNPSLRVFARVRNGGTTTSNLQLYVGGRQYGIIGRYLPKYRFTGAVRGPRALLDGTMRPLVSFQIKSGFRDRSIKLQGFSMKNGGNVPAELEIRLDGTLSGFSFGSPGNYRAGDTALEVDISATSITGGAVVYAGDFIDAGNAGAVGFSSIDVDLDLPEESTITLCAAGIGGTPTVTSGFRMKEEW